MQVWGSVLTEKTPLPTNAWYENLVLGKDLASESTSRVFSIPYVLDTAGATPGVRTHGTGVKAEATTVEQTWNPLYGVTLGAVESLSARTVSAVPFFFGAALSQEGMNS